MVNNYNNANQEIHYGVAIFSRHSTPTSALIEVVLSRGSSLRPTHPPILGLLSVKCAPELQIEA